MSLDEKRETTNRDEIDSSSHDTKYNNGSKNWFFRMWARMGNLPEFKVGGRFLQGKQLNNAIALIASTGFLMFGYDQGVLSGLLTLDSFQRDLPLMTPLETSNSLCWTEEGPPHRDYRYCTGDANTQAAGVAVYQIGCFVGAIVILFYGEYWGRRSSTFWGSSIMVIATIMQAASHEYGLFSAGRILSGIGNGMVTSTIPTWQSECARPEKRGKLIILSGALISGGVMISYWVAYGFYFLEGSVRWRFPVMFQSFFTIIVMIGLLWLPDSPRWLLMRGRTAEARNVTSRLLGKPEDDPEVLQEMNIIESALKAQNSGGGFKFQELLQNGPSQNLRRTALGMLSQFLQQMCGE